jgi:DNA-binding CsgD family transcriptional regulator
VTVRTPIRNVARKVGAHNKLEVLARARLLDIVNDRNTQTIPAA